MGHCLMGGSASPQDWALETGGAGGKRRGGEKGQEVESWSTDVGKAKPVFSSVLGLCTYGCTRIAHLFVEETLRAD